MDRGGPAAAGANGRLRMLEGAGEQFGEYPMPVAGSSKRPTAVFLKTFAPFHTLWYNKMLGYQNLRKGGE